MNQNDRAEQSNGVNRLTRSAAAICPVFPVSDLYAAAKHYEALGFEVEEYASRGYAFIRAGRAEIHLLRVPDLDPSTSTSSCYLYVGDADALYREWEDSEALGYLIPPMDTDYGLREFSHVDIDGNLIRVGSPLA